MQNKKSFNIFGFDRYTIDNKTYRYCSIHPYKRLIESKTDITLLFCPECGSEYSIKDTVKEQDIQSDVPPSNSSGSKIIQAKKQKKQYDDKGNEVLDPDLKGYHVISYNEQKSGKEGKRHIVRKRR